MATATRTPTIWTGASMKTKTTKRTIRSARISQPFLAVNIHDWRISMAIGMILGMLIVGLPQLLGVALLLSIMLLTLKLVEKDRL